MTPPPDVLISENVQEVFDHLFSYNPDVHAVTSVSTNRHPFANQLVPPVGTVAPVAYITSLSWSLKCTLTPDTEFPAKHEPHANFVAILISW